MSDHHAAVSEGTRASNWLWAVAAGIVAACVAVWLAIMSLQAALLLGAPSLSSTLWFWPSSGKTRRTAMLTITAITGTKHMAPTQPNGSFEARLIAVVITLAALLWLGVEYLGGQMNWPPKFVFLAGLSAGAAFLWAMIASYRLWRKRQV